MDEDVFFAKDFIETSEGLVFAVVENGIEQGRVLCFLRYIFLNSIWQKVNTDQANHFLSQNHPHYLYWSSVREAHLHAVFLNDILKHHQPRVRLQNLLANIAKDNVEKDLIKLCRLLMGQGLNFDDVGITGSILIAAQKQSSDIDLVYYSREGFHQARKIVQKLINLGYLAELNEQDWQASYDRRSCELSFSEYLWHEKRKFNKAVINQRKFDLTLVPATMQTTAQKHYTKLKPINLEAQVLDDTLAFDYPAEFKISHPQISSVVSYTATYTGQAQTGEWIEVSGLLEQSSDGVQRVIVGSSREASGEFIKVYFHPEDNEQSNKIA